MYSTYSLFQYGVNSGAHSVLLTFCLFFCTVIFIFILLYFFLLQFPLFKIDKPRDRAVYHFNISAMSPIGPINYRWDLTGAYSGTEDMHLGFRGARERRNTESEKEKVNQSMTKISICNDAIKCQ